MVETSFLAQNLDPAVKGLRTLAHVNGFSLNTYTPFAKLLLSLNTDRSSAYPISHRAPSSQSPSWKIDFFGHSFSPLAYESRPAVQLEMLRCLAAYSPAERRGKLTAPKKSVMIAGRRPFPVVYYESHIRDRLRERMLGDEVPAAKFLKVGHYEIARFSLMFLQAANAGMLFKEYPASIAMPVPTGIVLGEIREGHVGQDSTFSIHGYSGNNAPANSTPIFPQHVVVKTYLDLDGLGLKKEMIDRTLRQIGTENEPIARFSLISLMRYLGTMTDFSGMPSAEVVAAKLNVTGRKVDDIRDMLDLNSNVRTLVQLCELAEEIIPLLEPEAREVARERPSGPYRNNVYAFRPKGMG